MVTSRELLQQALKNGYAVGAFNFSNLETLQAIVEANCEENRPFIIQASESALKYMGLSYIKGMVSAACEASSVPLALHLDHGKNFEICKECIDAGFSSVMIDKSSVSFEENIQETKKVVEYAHSRGVSVEAELGTLAGVEDDVKVGASNAFYTDPQEAKEFIERTGVDSLAVAIGTSHGPNKGKTASPKLDIKRLQEIHSLVGEGYPLVLHGASSVYPDLVQECNDLGAQLSGAFGITDEDIKASVNNGVAKINVDTDIRLSMLAGILKSLKDNPNNIDPRRYLGLAKEKAKLIIKRKLSTFKPSEVL